MLLLDCATLDYRAVPFPDELVIAVIDSGEHRNLAHTPYNKRRREAEAGKPKRRRHVDSEIARVHDFVQALEERDFETLGELLKESHVSLRDDFEVSTQAGRRAGGEGLVDLRLPRRAHHGRGFRRQHHRARCGAGSERVFEAQIGRPVILCSTADGAYTRHRCERLPAPAARAARRRQA